MKKLYSAILALSLAAYSSDVFFLNDFADKSFGSVCSAAVSDEISVTRPNPVISRDVPAYSGKGEGKNGNDQHYFTFWQSSAGDYLAYDLSEVPENQRSRVIAVWYNVSAFDNVGMYVNRSSEPEDYVIEVNSAEGGAYPEDGWKTVKEVTDNTLSSRQTVVDMKGYNWIRLRVTKCTGDSVSVNFDIHDASEGVYDSWLFLGDSITAGSMPNCYGTGFAEYLTRLDSRFYPVQENGGIGGITSTDAVNNIEKWLSDSSARYVSIAYGTNDAWGDQTGTEKYYSNTKFLIDTVIAAGKIPVLPSIPYSTNKDVGNNLEKYNAQIFKLYEEYSGKIVKGPDFYEIFKESPDMLSGDGVHPSSEGYDRMRSIWAETMYKAVYNVSEETPSEPETAAGDVNGDGVLNSSDLTGMAEYLLGIKETDESTLKRCDLSEDGRLDITDFIKLKSMFCV